jgi:hypothetical protein
MEKRTRGDEDYHVHGRFIPSRGGLAGVYSYLFSLFFLAREVYTAF